MIRAQVWKGASLTIDRTESTVFRFSGPFTAHGMYASLSPDAFRNLFESPPRDGYPPVHIFDPDGSSIHGLARPWHVDEPLRPLPTQQDSTELHGGESSCPGIAQVDQIVVTVLPIAGA